MARLNLYHETTRDKQTNILIVVNALHTTVLSLLYLQCCIEDIIAEITSDISSEVSFISVNYNFFTSHLKESQEIFSFFCNDCF